MCKCEHLFQTTGPLASESTQPSLPLPIQPTHPTLVPHVQTDWSRSQPASQSASHSVSESVSQSDAFANGNPGRGEDGNHFIWLTHITRENFKRVRWKLSGQLWCQRCQRAMKYIPLKNTLLEGWAKKDGKVHCLTCTGTEEYRGKRGAIGPIFFSSYYADFVNRLLWKSFMKTRGNVVGSRWFQSFGRNFLNLNL